MQFGYDRMDLKAIWEMSVNTVKAYLKDGGFYGKVTVEPLGEFVTVELDDPSRYSDEERRELNRRVELQLVPSTIAYPKGRTCG